MNLHEIHLEGYNAESCDSLDFGTAGSYGNEFLSVTLGEGWQGLATSAIFLPCGVKVNVSEGTVVEVPWEATSQELPYTKSKILFQGVSDGRCLNTYTVRYSVSGPNIRTVDPQPPTPSQYEQFVQEVKEDANKAANAAAASAESAAAAEQSAKNAATAATDVAQSGQQAIQNVKDAGTQAVTDIGNAKDSALEAIDTAREEAASSISAGVEGAKQAAAQAEKSAADAEQSAKDAATELANVQAAGKSALDDIATELQNTLSDIQNEGTKQQSAIAGSGTAALEAIGQTEQAVINQVKQAGATQVSTVQSVGATQVSAVQSAGTTQIGQINNAGATQVSTVETAGTNAVEDVNDAKTAALEEIEDANASLPNPTQADAGKVPTVKADGSAYELAGPYAPLSAAIRPTASGNPVSITDSVEWPLLGLKVYGKSTQDGTPSPENPVPIVSAGDGGSIDLTVSNSADQSQQLTISTPNGLPGVSVDSGGNYTDAEGQQLVCDYKDYARRVYVQKTRTYIFNGTESWNTWGVNYSANGLTGFYYYIDENDPDASKNMLCSLLTQNNNSWGGKEIGIGISSPETSVQNYIMCTVSNDILSDVSSDEAAIESWKAILSDKGMTVIFTLVSPIETPLSEEEIAAYRALHTYDDATVVSTAEDVAGLEVKYLADAQKYIDNRLTTALSTMSKTYASYEDLSGAIREGVNTTK